MLKFLRKIFKLSTKIGPPLLVRRPFITGTPKVGQKLTANVGTWITQVLPYNIKLPNITGNLQVGEELFCHRGNWG